MKAPPANITPKAPPTAAAAEEDDDVDMEEEGREEEEEEEEEEKEEEEEELTLVTSLLKQIWKRLRSTGTQVTSSYHLLSLLARRYRLIQQNGLTTKRLQQLQLQQLQRGANIRAGHLLRAQRLHQRLN